LEQWLSAYVINAGLAGTRCQERSGDQRSQRKDKHQPRPTISGARLSFGPGETLPEAGDLRLGGSVGAGDLPG